MEYHEPNLWITTAFTDKKLLVSEGYMFLLRKHQNRGPDDCSIGWKAAREKYLDNAQSSGTYQALQ